MRKPELSVLSALLVLCAVGCGGKTGVVGKWKAKEAVPRATSEMGQRIEAILLKTRIEFRGDGTMSMEAGPLNAEGKYKANGSLITVEMDNSMASSTVIYELSADGKTLTRKSSTSDDKLIFERD
jgi:hypothetical protein